MTNRIAPDSPRVAVIVASAARAETAGQLLRDLKQQTHSDFTVKVVVPDAASAPVAGGSPWPPTDVITHGVASASSQRNAGISAAEPADFFFFFDDDAVPRSDYITNALEVFSSNPDVVALTGEVIADGASPHVPEVSHAEAEQLLHESLEAPPDLGLRPANFLYGCNMAVRRIAAEPPSFDERLPLYSWLEDLDLTMRLKRHGRVVIAPTCVAVHLGHTSGGRTAHRRLGYSHVMNPIYLMRKGTLSPRQALGLCIPRLGKNAIGLALAPAERSWRVERARGHLLALADIVRFRITPERIMTIPR